MKTRSNLSEWLRWRIAGFLNLFPDTCWSALVMWAMFDDCCVQDIVSQTCDCAWCGKCAFNDRLNEPLVRDNYREWKGFEVRFKSFADFCCDHLCHECSKELKPAFQGKAEIRFK